MYAEGAPRHLLFRMDVPVGMLSASEARAIDEFSIPASATVLIVDDSRTTRAIMRSRVGALLEGAADAAGSSPRQQPIVFPPVDATEESERAQLIEYAETLAALVRAGPVVLFSDQDLGVGVPRGSSVISRVRAAVPEAEHNLVAFVVSCNGSSADRRMYAAAGADAYVSKEKDGLRRARAQIARACWRRWGGEAPRCARENRLSASEQGRPPVVRYATPPMDSRSYGFNAVGGSHENKFQRLW